MDSPKEDEASKITHYESSGIDERHGSVPKWLTAVYIVLLIWMVYYLVRFWTDQG